ncbi:sulfotransferase [Sphingomonas sp. HITSZ_GF]|uniref:sulfotransferase n=1 Tax=Sphingomonas sp. HITSZ_GF TaxID=3037247 RepID=UPI00240E5BBE|nr:sulfotransferase [Sphingomonas sp. HITSZ_GF]MDG2535768.1 sulfotransferase [Sphingomonas sp. HITSZ_GF]
MLAAATRLAITGTHRSGTTLLGRLIAADRGSARIFEPFNRDFGIEGVDRWYANADGADHRWDDLLDRFLRGEEGRFRTTSSLFKQWAYWLKPSSNQRVYHRAVRVPPNRLILKDPFLALASRQLIERYGFKVIYTIKHPVAFYRSLVRVGWHNIIPLDDLVAQGALDPAARAAAQTPAAEAGLLWNLVNAHAVEVRAAHPLSVSFCLHEDFCHNPIDETRRVAADLGIPFTPAIQDAVERLTSGTVVSPPASKIHELVRNAQALPDLWRGEINAEDERALRELCEPLYDEIYRRLW